MNRRELVRKLVKKLKKETLPFLTTVLCLAVLIALVIVTSILIDENVHSGMYFYESNAFDWHYTPADSGLVPMNASYANYTVLLDGHSHTYYSDGDLSPEQNIQWHIANGMNQYSKSHAQGYNAMVLSDHNNLDGALATQKIAREKYNDQIKVLLGLEYSCCRIHMTLTGITTPIIPTEAFPSDEELQQVIIDVHAQGGVVTVNHIPWSLNGNTLPDHPTIEQLYSWGVDYVEVVGQNRFDWVDWQFAAAHGMGAIAGTDMHYPDRGVNGWTTLIPANFTEEAIMEELKARRTSFIYNGIDSPYSAQLQFSSQNVILDPFFKIAGIINSYYWVSQGMYSFTGTHCAPKHSGIYWDLIFAMVFWLFMWLIFYLIIKKLFILACKGIRALVLRKRKGRSSDYALMDNSVEPFIEDSVHTKKYLFC